MNVNPPTKPVDKTPEKPTENKFDPFRPEMPQIPGVSHAPGRAVTGSRTSEMNGLLPIGGIAVVAVLLVGAVVFWWVRNRTSGTASPSSDSNSTTQESPAPPLPPPVPAAREGPTIAATVDELAKPWAAKKFTFVKPVTQENIEAMVIRLPNGGLWAFSLQGPYGHCNLEFVTDLAALASKYRYNASHPMVVSPCDGTIYDPLKVGPLGGNTWARGEIVQGSSLRPPISIDVKVSGRSIVADSIE